MPRPPESGSDGQGESPLPKSEQTRERYWLSAVPAVCDLCRQAIAQVFIDGRTVYGPWACLCEDCHVTKGTGLGLGNGQRYERTPDGKWRKVEG